MLVRADCWKDCRGSTRMNGSRRTLCISPAKSLVNFVCRNRDAIYWDNRLSDKQCSWTVVPCAGQVSGITDTGQVTEI